jgi:hypothetical protein
MERGASKLERAASGGAGVASGHALPLTKRNALALVSGFLAARSPGMTEHFKLR